MKPRGDGGAADGKETPAQLGSCAGVAFRPENLRPGLRRSGLRGPAPEAPADPSGVAPTSTLDMAGLMASAVAVRPRRPAESAVAVHPRDGRSSRRHPTA
ncbi:hypothetical protein GCM10027075_11760 [Streptomyces heilongjiangensis]